MWKHRSTAINLWQTLPVGMIFLIMAIVWPISLLRAFAKSADYLCLKSTDLPPRPTEWMAMNRLTLPLLLLTLTLIGSGCRTLPSCSSCHFPGETVGMNSCGGCGQVDCCDVSCCGPKYDVCLPRIPWGALRDCIRARVTCGAGCSEEVYWGEWFSDPPKCDPCCGDQYVGPRPPGSCRPRLIELLRIGKHCGTGNCGSCSGCGSSPAYQMSSGHSSEIHYSGEMHHHGETVPGEYYEPSEEVYHMHQQPTYPTSSGTRSPHQLGRGSL